jgi:hypothetical protein
VKELREILVYPHHLIKDKDGQGPPDIQSGSMGFLSKKLEGGAFQRPPSNQPDQ